MVKCRLQVDKEKYKSLGNGFKLTVAEQGVRGLFLGWAPTAITSRSFPYGVVRSHTP